jgi:anti-anti-sigma factor
MSERTVSFEREPARSRSRGKRSSLKGRGAGLTNRDPAAAEALQASAEILQIRTARLRAGLWVSLSGELTATTTARLADCLDQALDGDYVTPIVVDLSDLRTLAPAAVATLLIAHRRAFDDHRELLLVRGSTAVQQVVDRIDGPFLYTS